MTYKPRATHMKVIQYFHYLCGSYYTSPCYVWCLLSNTLYTSDCISPRDWVVVSKELERYWRKRSWSHLRYSASLTLRGLWKPPTKFSPAHWCRSRDCNQENEKHNGLNQLAWFDHSTGTKFVELVKIVSVVVSQEVWNRHTVTSSRIFKIYCMWCEQK